MGGLEVKHKWHKEIKAWADGAEIQHRLKDCWIDCEKPMWGEQTEYRIKPQSKEPKYLYVYTTDNGIEFGTARMAIKVNSLKDRFECIGKIKLESEE